MKSIIENKEEIYDDLEIDRRNRRPPPPPPPPDEPPFGNMIDVFFPGRGWRRISLDTFVKALIITGAFASTILNIYNRLKNQKYFDGGNIDNNGLDNIENPPMFVTPSKPGTFQKQPNTVIPGTIPENSTIPETSTIFRSFNSCCRTNRK